MSIRHPKLELVGLHANAEAKQGKDAGELAGLDVATGVKATNDVDALIALAPDCCVYMANGELRAKDATDDMARLLRAGIDVVGVALIQFIYPAHGDPNLRDVLEEACRVGGSTLFINGIDPGFSGDVLPLAALQIAGEVEEIRVQEICDYSTYEDPDFTGVAFGFGGASRALRALEKGFVSEIFQKHQAPGNVFCNITTNQSDLEHSPNSVLTEGF